MPTSPSAVPTAAPQAALFGTTNIRTVLIDGATWFVAVDAANALGYGAPWRAIGKHCKGTTRQAIRTNDSVQSMLIVPESDVFRLTLHSPLPAAEEFEKWVVGNVLPALLRSGGYVVGQERLAAGEMTSEEFMAKAVQVAEEIVAAADAKRMAASGT